MRSSRVARPSRGECDPDSGGRATRALIVPLSLSVAIFAFLYRFIPRRRVRWDAIWIAAFMGGASWEIAKRVFAWYLDNLASYSLVYGSVATLIVLMLWVYLTGIMDDLVEGSGLEGGGKIQIAVEDLALKTGFAPMMAGPNGAASYGQLVTLAIPAGADPQARDIVQFFLTGQNYQDVLALAPFGKVPVLESALEGWKSLSPFFASYADETLDQIANGERNWLSFIRAFYRDGEGGQSARLAAHRVREPDPGEDHGAAQPRDRGREPVRE